MTVDGVAVGGVGRVEHRGYDGEGIGRGVGAVGGVVGLHGAEAVEESAEKTI